jgi:acetyl-CoA carboxylase biotin carboxyl carrier protein
MPGKTSKGNPSDPGRVWNLEDIQQLLDLLATKEITEFEMEQQGVKIRVQRGVVHSGNPGNFNGYVVAPGAIATLPGPPPTTLAPAPAVVAAPTSAAVEPAAESTEGLFIMKSPIVGTFYSAPSPSAPPFAAVGDSVKVGQVVCIIEAMKLMNELESEVAGKIVRTYCENGQPVEYGQTLFAIEPARKK